MKRIVTVLLGIALMLTMAVAMTGCGKKDAQTAENTAPQVTSTQKADEAKKAEEAKKKEEAKKAEEAKKKEEAKKAEEAKKKAEEAKKAAESKQPQNSVKPSQSPAPSADQATGSPVQRYSGRPIRPREARYSAIPVVGAAAAARWMSSERPITPS